MRSINLINLFVVCYLVMKKFTNTVVPNNEKIYWINRMYKKIFDYFNKFLW